MDFDAVVAMALNAKLEGAKRLIGLLPEKARLEIRSLGEKALSALIEATGGASPKAGGAAKPEGIRKVHIDAQD